jgi:hypothetical protein
MVVSCSSATWTSCSQVTGSFSGSRPDAWATDFLYQSSWVLAQNGTATSSSFQVDPSTELWTASAVTRSATSSGTGARNPASANSGM